MQQPNSPYVGQLEPFFESENVISPTNRGRCVLCRKIPNKRKIWYFERRGRQIHIPYIAIPVN